MNAEPGAWDLASLREMLGDDLEIIASLTDLYIEDSSQRLESIGRAIESADLANVRSEAHALKGASGNIRAHAAQEAAARLEQAAKQGERELCKKLFDDLCKAVSRLKIEFSRLGDRALAA